MHPADLADIVEELAPDDREVILESIDERGRRRDAVGGGARLQAQILESLDREKAADIVEEMDSGRGRRRAEGTPQRRPPARSSRRWTPVAQPT